MRYVALACDYDGTLATNGQVAPKTLEALKLFKGSGRKLILVTGRQLGDLLQVFPEVKIFDCIVAENGGVLFLSESNREVLLGEGPPQPFIQALYKRGVKPLDIGRSIIATRQPYEKEV